MKFICSCSFILVLYVEVYLWWISAIRASYNISSHQTSKVSFQSEIFVQDNSIKLWYKPHGTCQQWGRGLSSTNRECNWVKVTNQRAECDVTANQRPAYHGLLWQSITWPNELPPDDQSLAWQSIMATFLLTADTRIWMMMGFMVNFRILYTLENKTWLVGGSQACS